MLAACVAGAVLWRAPWLVFTELNWDESLYRLIGDALLHGHAPYAAIWDRKPAGLFVLVALVQAVAGPGALALHLAAAVAVGLGAWCLAGIARVLLPGLALAGPVAAVLWIVYADRSGGTGANAELFFVPLNLAGFWLMLGARGMPGLFGAGLLLGAALQVKYNAAFIWPACGLGWLLLSRRPVATWRAAVAVGLGAALPTLAVLGWYALVGRLGDWASANLAAQGDTLRTAFGVDPDMLPFALRRYALPVAGTVLALAWLACRAERRFAAVLVAWLAGDALALWFLHRLADHMMIQILPPLCLGTGWAAARALQAMPSGRWRAGVAALAALAWLGWSGRDSARPFAAAAEVLARRQGGDGANWGDPTATAGALLAGRLAPDETIYVFGGPILGIYQAAGRAPPTRFPFAEHLWSGYAPVDGQAELARILATRPAFIAVAGSWAPGKPSPPGGERVFAAMHAALAQDYVPDAAIPPYVSRAGGPIGPRETILLFRRRYMPPG